MRMLSGIGAALALLSELALLAAGVGIGLALPAPLPVRIAVAVLLPVAVIAVWARWSTTRSARRLPVRGRLLLEAGLFALGVIGLAAAGLVAWALALTVLTAARFAVGARVGQA